MGRFGWHSGKIKATAVEYAANAAPDYGLDMRNVSSKKADVLLSNAVTIMTGAGVPTDGTSGDGVGSGPGSLYIDVTNANHYINGGTAASPTWKLVTRAA